MANEINVNRGNDRTVTANLIDDETNAGIAWADFRDKTVTLMVKLNAADKDDKAIITKTGTIDTEVNGKVIFILTQSDTSNGQLKDNVAYPCEIVCVLDGLKYTALKTDFTIVR